MGDTPFQVDTTFRGFLELGKSEFSRIADFTFHRQLRPIRSTDLEIDLQTVGG
jgi:hypothetical protein